MSSLWVAVVSRRELKLFKRTLADEQLQFIGSFVNPLAGQSESAISRHRPGVVAEGGNGSHHHLLNAGISPQEIGLAAFVKQMAKALDKERAKGHLNELIVIAEPRVLGLMRGAVSSSTFKIVSRWIPKDLGKAPVARLTETIARLSPDRPMPPLRRFSGPT